MHTREHSKGAIKMYKPGDEVIYFGSNQKMYGENGVIVCKIATGIWKVGFDGGVELFAGEQELKEGSWSYKRGLFD
jgi:hypothetical protein